MRARTTTAVAVAAVYAAVIAWAELLHWNASRRGFGPGCVGGDEVVLVLGFRNRGDRANAINRWRVRAGLRSVSRDGDGSRTVVFSGGVVRGAHSEADLMARYARSTLGYRGRIVTETASRSTWENIGNVLPLLEPARRIVIVSNPLHAEKARQYLRRRRPDLAARLVRAADYRFGEMFALKPVLAVVSLWKVARNAREMRSRGGRGAR